MVAIFPNVYLWRRSYAQNWKVLTLKNCVTVSSHLHMPVRPLLLHRMALVSFRLYVSEKFFEFFWEMVYRPPWQKISRTPMLLTRLLIVVFS